MKLNQALLEEFNVLLQFDLSNTQQGIKIHNDAEASVSTAAERLFNKGLIDQVDGGYLTPLGRTAAEHAQALSGVLTTS
ncbi:MAG: DNA-binding protein [Cycloclasticus sp. symbiont of Bathymodiolus heckerae]|nr:MAG: DNA-binding protein [Cycloclasticus sp. symbiont of Bathymodiolus heckerae]